MVYTIGHSTRSTEEFIDFLITYQISTLVDIRSIPKSRHNPHFEQSQIERSLKKSNIHYEYLEKLGGLQPKIKNNSIDESNNGWINRSFHNYANYMQTVSFQEGLDKLIEIAKNSITAIMCAEAVPWRCHRSLVADALIVRNFSVCEIIGVNNIRPHKLTSFAVVEAGNITYPKSSVS